MCSLSISYNFSACVASGAKVAPAVVILIDAWLIYLTHGQFSSCSGNLSEHLLADGVCFVMELLIQMYIHCTFNVQLLNLTFLLWLLVVFAATWGCWTQAENTTLSYDHLFFSCWYGELVSNHLLLNRSNTCSAALLLLPLFGPIFCLVFTCFHCVFSSTHSP